MEDLYKAHICDLDEYNNLHECKYNDSQSCKYEQYPQCGQDKDDNSLGAHYKQGNIEVIDLIDAYNLNFNLGNTVKYISRCNYKNNTCPNCCTNTSTKVNDLRKAIWYIEREIEKST